MIFNNLLTVIMGQSQVLLNEPAASSRSKSPWQDSTTSLDTTSIPCRPGNM